MTIREHPLAWRWTHPQHTVLPDGVLAQMHLIDRREAEHLFQNARGFLLHDNLARKQFATIVRHSADVSGEDGCRWLRDQQPDLSISVGVSWNQKVAIRTSWEVYTAHWGTFCYPGSDDVLVWPDSKSWVLFYSHEEEFQFGRRSKAEPTSNEYSVGVQWMACH